MLKLIKPDKAYERQYREMMDEWTSAGEKIVPHSIRRLENKSFEEYIAGLREEERGIEDLVPATTFWAYDGERDKMIGAVSIRHCLNKELFLSGGHIGDGVRPSERGKGYATQMIAQALAECRRMGMDRVLMVCGRENIVSRKSILKNGGVLENEIENPDGTVNQRYWIEL